MRNLNTELQLYTKVKHNLVDRHGDLYNALSKNSQLTLTVAHVVSIICIHLQIMYYFPNMEVDKGCIWIVMAAGR